MQNVNNRRECAKAIVRNSHLAGYWDAHALKRLYMCIRETKIETGATYDEIIAHSFISNINGNFYAFGKYRGFVG